MEGLVGAWMPRLGLTHWKVKVNWNKAADEDADASTDLETPYDLATIRFATAWDTWAPDYAETVVVHELLHLVTRDMEEAVGLAFEALPKPARKLAESWHHHELEGVVDRIASSLVALATAHREVKEAPAC